jgi:hypothetical protein
MTMQIIIEVPERLKKQLRRFQDRLPEVLERGVQEMLGEQSDSFQDERAIMELLTSQPAPEEVIAIRPSPEFQARVDELLSQNKMGALSPQDELELERYLTLEHLVRLAKAHAYAQLNQHQWQKMS